MAVVGVGGCRGGVRLAGLNLLLHHVLHLNLLHHHRRVPLGCSVLCSTCSSGQEEPPADPFLRLYRQPRGAVGVHLDATIGTTWWGFLRQRERHRSEKVIQRAPFPMVALLPPPNALPSATARCTSHLGTCRRRTLDSRRREAVIFAFSILSLRALAAGFYTLNRLCSYRCYRRRAGRRWDVRSRTREHICRRVAPNCGWLLDFGGL